MNPQLALGLIAGYFGILILISFFSSKKKDNQTFFTGGRNTPWYIIAFGMIGTSISGVTFISVPGAIGPGKFGYMQVVLGYMIGYFAIGTVLMPLYYRLNLTSIYQYLQQRFGESAYKTGAAFFLLSRLVGSSLRLYVVAVVLQLAVFDHFGLPFWVTVAASVGLIYLYTFQSGVQTVIWTDTAQTVGLLAGLLISIVIIAKTLHLGAGGLASLVLESPRSQWIFTDWHAKNYFWKHFLGGAAVALAMTGLDQDMMQKNLACKNLREAQKNMFWFSLTLIGVNLLFMSLGILLYEYGAATGVIRETLAGKYQLEFLSPSGQWSAIRTDQLFPRLAFDYLGGAAAITFVLGVIAAAYSSADSALTALTTSFCVDILGLPPGDSSDLRRKRMLVHVGFAAAMVGIILYFHARNDAAVIDKVLEVAGYTYGPLLGLFFFGLLTKRRLIAPLVPVVCVVAPAISYGLSVWIPAAIGYNFGLEMLIVNGLITFGLLALVSKQ